MEVLPGVIDADYQGEIKIMIRPLKDTIQIHKNQHIAQLLLIPYVKTPNPILKQERGNQGFGSTEVVAWIQEITHQRPLKTIYVEGKAIKGLLDTGADRSCIAAKDWPSSWPVQRTWSTFVGLGSANNVVQSSKLLQWVCEQKVGNFQPYIISSLPFSLWGRDIMEEMDVHLVTSNNLGIQNFS